MFVIKTPFNEGNHRVWNKVPRSLKLDSTSVSESESDLARLLNFLIAFRLQYSPFNEFNNIIGLISYVKV